MHLGVGNSAETRGIAQATTKKMDELNPLEQPQAETPQAATLSTQTAEESVGKLSASELVEYIAVLLQRDELPERKQVESLRNLFNRKKEQLRTSGDTSALEAVELQEERLGDLLANYRELDRKRSLEQEELFARNASSADALMAKLEALLSETEDFQHIYKEFHHIREEWEMLRPLSQQDEARLRKVFGTLRERFYELKSINEELREYDFKKNLEAKQELLVELRRLAEHSDVVYALRHMSPIVAKWHDLGPVARDLRAEVHGEYKELTGGIYRRHQAFQDERHQQEQSNSDAKMKLIERIEAILMEELPTKVKEWNTLTDKVKALQEDWRAIGSSSRKDSEKLYQRFRAGMDTFFQLKKEALLRQRSKEHANLEEKNALLKRAEELRDSTDWVATAAELRELQRQWHEIGGVPREHSQRIWEAFRGHIDHFFEQRKLSGNDPGKLEQENLAAKEEILRQLREEFDRPDQAVHISLKDLAARWSAIGHVPQGRRGKLETEYRHLMDKLFSRVRLGGKQRRLEGFSQQIKGGGQNLEDKLRRLERARERMVQELKAYERNRGFLNLNSSSALLRDVERKQQEHERELQLLDEKIALLREEMAK